MIGFFQEDENSKSMSRLCMFLGINGGIAYALINKSPDWRVIATLMLGGCVPYIANIFNRVQEKALANPKIVDILIKRLKK